MARKRKNDIRSYTNSDQFIGHADDMGADLTRKKNSMKVSTDEGPVHVPIGADLDKGYRHYLIKQFIRLGIFVFLVLTFVKFLFA